ncbi:MAG: hypothetical protein Q4D30_10330 [Bacteroidales bacterium]|nr:hypothetical protein [Bacteroidales bacterium]
MYLDVGVQSEMKSTLKRKAGVDAELHIYGEGTGGMFGGTQGTDRNTPNG